jgi:HK97 gp10 family phage protein
MITIKIANLPAIQRAFGQAPKEMTANLNEAIKKSVFEIQSGEVDQYKSLGIRVITGGLIGSIERGTYFSNLKGEVGPNVTGSPGVDYALYVHEGTSKMASRPFLLNAVQDKDKKVQKYFVDAVQKTLDDVARGT